MPVNVNKMHITEFSQTILYCLSFDILCWDRDCSAV